MNQTPPAQQYAIFNLQTIDLPSIMSDILATPGLRFFAYRIKPEAPFTAVVTNFAAAAIVYRILRYCYKFNLSFRGSVLRVKKGERTNAPDLVCCGWIDVPHAATWKTEVDFKPFQGSSRRPDVTSKIRDFSAKTPL